MVEIAPHIFSKKILTPEQFSEIAKKLPEIRSQKREFAELVKSKPDKVKEILGEGYSWSDIYELSFNEQLAYLFVLLKMQEPIKQAANSTNPQSAFLEMCRDGAEFDKCYAENESSTDKKHLIWLVMILQRNVLSIMLFHQSLGALVEQVRGGSNEALFKAVSVDRSILICPTFSDRLSFAELANDKDFFIHLRKALKGPSKKHMEAIGDLRYAIVLLREVGFDRYTDDELVTYFVSNRLYPNNVSAVKNLRKHIQDSKKYTTI